jgi:hypothetical protein
MSKSLVLIALTLTAIVATPREASAIPIPVGLAQGLCKGWWYINMNTGVNICSYCEKTPAGTTKCDYFVCDESSCDWIVVEKRKPKGRWIHPTPVIPRISRS